VNVVGGPISVFVENHSPDTDHVAYLDVYDGAAWNNVGYTATIVPQGLAKMTILTDELEALDPQADVFMARFRIDAVCPEGVEIEILKSETEPTGL